MSKIRPELVAKELKKRASQLKVAPEKPFIIQDFCFDKQLAFIQDPARFKTAVCSRRCLAKDTLVQTLSGPKPIQNIMVGDWVYSEHGLPVQVLQTFSNGPKEVVALLHNSRPIVECTPDHVFLIVDAHVAEEKQLAVKDFTESTQIRQNYIEYFKNPYRQEVSFSSLKIELGPTSTKSTYDIHVDSPTNLYMLANGLITHNSGKSIACAADLLHTAQTVPGDVLYITLNRRNAKRILWRELLRINKDYAINAKIDNTELTMTLPNGNVVHVSGAKDESEIQKYRGMALRKVYIDEAQSFRGYLKELIEDIIEPALTDYYGSLILIGTPGPVPAGFFFEVTHSPGYSHHHWTMQQNPFIKIKSGQEPLDQIKELAERRGLTLDHPTILREYFGQWAEDKNARVYQFDPALNLYVALPTDLRYVFGIDIGYKDADAIAVLGYSESQRKVYLVDEYIRTKNDISSLVAQIKMLKDKYDPVKMVMDAGALGRKIQEEILTRHSLPLVAAEKSRKLEYIALLNDDLRTGKLQALPNSRFAEDSALVQWDYSVPERPTVSTGYHSDICDSVLYAWRECRHFYEQSSPPAPKTVDQYMQDLEQQEADAMEAKRYSDSVHTDVENWADLGITSDYSDDF